jgi:ABC-type nitrate/sulfonate/bicarbonate transport system substrate-binding protein
VIRALGSILVLAVLAAVAPGPSTAADLPTIRVGAGQLAASFIPIYLGDQAGIWQQAGIKLDFSALRGEAQLQQAMAAGNVDIGLGGGSGLAYIIKGSPVLAVASLAGPPDNMVMFVGPNSPIKAPKDLRGRRIGVTSHGSTTEWLAQEMAVQQGWPQDAVTIVPLGDTKGQVAALKRGEIDAFVTSAEYGYDLQDTGNGKILVTMGDVIKRFQTHVIIARTDFIAAHPDLVKRFLLGWFRSVAYMGSHRDEAIALGAKVESIDKPSMERVYDLTMKMASRDGTFDMRVLDLLAHEYVSRGILDEVPQPSRLITTQFVPVHI